MKNQTSLFLIALAALLLHSCSPAKVLSLEGGFQPGQQLKYRLTEKSETFTEPVSGEQDIPATHNLQTKVTDYTYTVKAVHPDRSVDLDMVITHVYEKETDNDGVTEYDSDSILKDSSDFDLSAGKGAGKELVYRILIGRQFHLKMSPQGQVLSLTGMDEAWNEIERQFANESPMAGSMLKNVKTQFGNEAMRTTQNDTWAYQPTKKVRVGQKWKRPYKFDAFKLSGSTTYTLREQDDKSAKINFVTHLATDKGSPGVIDMGVIKMRYDLVGTGTGTIITDQPHALPRRTEQTMVMSGPMGVKTSYTGWITVPLKVTWTSVFERVN